MPTTTPDQGALPPAGFQCPAPRCAPRISEVSFSRKSVWNSVPSFQLTECSESPTPSSNSAKREEPPPSHAGPRKCMEIEPPPPQPSPPYQTPRSSTV